MIAVHNTCRQRLRRPITVQRKSKDQRLPTPKSLGKHNCFNIIAPDPLAPYAECSQCILLLHVQSGRNPWRETVRRARCDLDYRPDANFQGTYDSLISWETLVRHPWSWSVLPDGTCCYLSTVSKHSGSKALHVKALSLTMLYQNRSLLTKLVRYL